MESKIIRKIRIKNFLLSLVLLILGAVFFALANPNPLFKHGLSFFAWFMYIPFLFLIKKSFLKSGWFYYGLYGVLCVCSYAYWLYNYDSLCLYLAIPLAFIGTALLGLALKAAEKLFIKNSWLIQFLILSTFDYLRTLGFLGFHYGLAAYTQWNFTSLIQIVSVIGPFGLNAFVIFSSAVIFALLSKSEDKKYFMHSMISDDKHYDGATYINYVSENSRKLKNTSLKIPLISFCIWFAFFIAFLVYGNIRLKKNQDYNWVTMLVVQNNDDPDKNGLESFSEAIYDLMSLTDEALEMNPDIQLVVWPENAVVPSILYHYNQNQDSDRKKLVSHVLEYFQNHKSSFITGNQHIEVNSITGSRDYYNSALLFQNNQGQKDLKPQQYNKMHLVPFSEYFPYQKYFPHIYKAILNKQKFFSKPGQEIIIFNSQSLSFYTPICFENTFPSLCRQAYKKGARAFVCIVNDSWAKSLSCQYQHLAMAKFRAVENGLPVAISAVSGQSAFINQNGQLMAMALPFTKSYVIGQLPLIPDSQKPTIYNRIGDLFGYGIAFLLLALLIIRALIAIINKVICQNAQKQ